MVPIFAGVAFDRLRQLRIHIIVDGWANSLIVQRVTMAYNALTGETSNAEQTYYSYRDFIQNDQSYLESENFAKA
jgi:hypothetical protein